MSGQSIRWNNKHNRRQCNASCPVTCGLPTRITEDAFVRACKEHQKRERAERADASRQNSVRALMTMRHAMDPCEHCQGKVRPAELEIITLADMQGIASGRAANHVEKQEPEEKTMRKKTLCDGCGKDKSLAMCSGQLLCSSCAAVAGAVSLRAGIVARMLVKRGKPDAFIGLLAEELGQPWLMAAIQPYLPENVPVRLENDTLERIAALVGYQGEDGEELVAETKKTIDQAALAMADGDRAVDLLRRVNVAMPDGEIDYERLPDRVARLVANNDLSRIYAAVGIEPGDEDRIDVILDAISVLTMTLERYKQQLDQREAAISEETLRGILGLDEGLPVLEYIEGVLMPSARAVRAQMDAIREQLCMDTLTGSVIDAVTDLVQGLDRYKEQCGRLAAENSAMAEQASEDAQRYLASEQVFAGLREVLGADGARNEELPQVVRERLSGVVLGVERSTARPTALDSHLLDLLVEFPAIGVERIAVLREAA